MPIGARSLFPHEETPDARPAPPPRPSRPGAPLRVVLRRPSAPGCWPAPARPRPRPPRRHPPPEPRPVRRSSATSPNGGTYDREYHAKNIETSGSGAELTHINYAFGNVTGGKCAMGDAYAATDRAYTAAESVDGVADTWDQVAARQLQPAAQAEEEAPGPQDPLVLRRLDLVRRLRRRPRGTRPPSPGPATTWSRTRGPTSSTASTSTGSTRTPAV